MCHNVFNEWPKTTLLPVWPRDAKGLDTPALEFSPCVKLTSCRTCYFQVTSFFGVHGENLLTPHHRLSLQALPGLSFPYLPNSGTVSAAPFSHPKITELLSADVLTSTLCILMGLFSKSFVGSVRERR